jgi:hypothetical protein
VLHHRRTRQRRCRAGEAAAAGHALLGCGSVDERQAVRREGRVLLVLVLSLVLLRREGCERGRRPSIGTVNSGRSMLVMTGAGIGPMSRKRLRERPIRV